MVVKLKRWTSDLTIYTDSEVPESWIISAVNTRLESIEKFYSVFKEDSEISKYNRGEILKFESELGTEFAINGGKLLKDAKAEVPLDYTGLLKGYAIDHLSFHLEEMGITNYVVNFGGDMKISKVNSIVRLNDFFSIRARNVNEIGICTSGNYGERGEHISLVREHNISTLTVFQLAYNLSLTKLDGVATSLYSEGVFEGLPKESPFHSIAISTEGNIMNRTYCASPFFNDEEREIRDNMISKFDDVFRPDQTESSKSYSGSPGKELAGKILQENLDNIKDCEFLVFPKGTADLGTLFEVGYAFRNKVPVIRYDHSNGQYELLLVDALNKIKVKSGNTIDCTKASGAVVLGFHWDELLNYYIGDLNDNIMLSEMFKRVDLKGNVIPPNYKEIL